MNADVGCLSINAWAPLNHTILWAIYGMHDHLSVLGHARLFEWSGARMIIWVIRGTHDHLNDLGHARSIEWSGARTIIWVIWGTHDHFSDLGHARSFEWSGHARSIEISGACTIIWEFWGTYDYLNDLGHARLFGFVETLMIVWSHSRYCQWTYNYFSKLKQLSSKDIFQESNSCAWKSGV